MKVVKLVRLQSKDEKGNFKKDGSSKVKRNRAVVSDEVVKESEENYKFTGLLYIVDEKATKEFLSPKKAKKETTKDESTSQEGQMEIETENK